MKDTNNKDEELVYIIEEDGYKSKEQIYQDKLDRLATQETIFELKEEYEKVFLTTINDTEFIFKPISPAKYQLILDTFDERLEIEEEVCKMCTISPILEDWHTEVTGGYISTLAEEILKESWIIGVDVKDIKKKFEKDKYSIETDLRKQMPLIIYAAFSYLRLEEIENWDLKKQVEWLSKANYILTTYKGMEDIEIE